MRLNIFIDYDNDYDDDDHYYHRHLEVNFKFVRSSSLVDATRLCKVGSYELT